MELFNSTRQLTRELEGALNFKIAQQYLDGAFTVSDQELIEATCLLLERAKILSELSGVAPIALAMKGLNLPLGSPIVCVISGGNIDLDHLATYISTRKKN